MQASSTTAMIFGVAELQTFCSASVKLEPGDILLTGTPWSCAEFMTSVRSGDVVEVGIDGIGTLRNPVVVAE